MAPSGAISRQADVPGARPISRLRKGAPEADSQAIAGRYPIVLVTPDPGSSLHSQALGRVPTDDVRSLTSLPGPFGHV